MIEIHPSFRTWMRRHRLNAWDPMVGLLDRTPRPLGNEVVVQRLHLGDGDGAPGDVFLKLYHHRSPSWKYLARHSKAACEFRNYRTFQNLRIPCPQPIAIGEKRDAIGRLKAAFILTQAVPDAVTLVEYFNRQELDRHFLDVRRQRLHLLAFLARQTRHLHDHAFYHNDLVWRNLLVTHDAQGAPAVAWIDCPRGGFSHVRWMQERRRLRDLGSFDKSASRQCSAGERLHFFKSYFGHAGKLTPQVKHRIRRVLDYWRRRWPDDWPAMSSVSD